MLIQRMSIFLEHNSKVGDEQEQLDHFHSLVAHAMFGRRLTNDVERQEEGVDGKKLQGQRRIALGQNPVQAIPIGRPQK